MTATTDALEIARPMPEPPDKRGAVSAADLIAAGRNAPPVFCYCGRSGYSAKCPMHSKATPPVAPNDDKGGTTDAD